MHLHRGRMIGHLQIVMEGPRGEQRFYAAVFEALGIPAGGAREDYFWYDG